MLPKSQQIIESREERGRTNKWKIVGLNKTFKRSFY
jgi:hypothetical protein